MGIHRDNESGPAMGTARHCPPAAIVRLGGAGVNGANPARKQMPITTPALENSGFLWLLIPTDGQVCILIRSETIIREDGLREQRL